MGSLENEVTDDTNGLWLISNSMIRWKPLLTWCMPYKYSGGYYSAECSGVALGQSSFMKIRNLVQFADFKWPSQFVPSFNLSLFFSFEPKVHRPIQVISLTDQSCYLCQIAKRQLVWLDKTAYLFLHSTDGLPKWNWNSIIRIWDTFHIKLPLEKSHSEHVEMRL